MKPDAFKDVVFEVRTGFGDVKKEVNALIFQDPADVEYLVTYLYKGDEYIMVATTGGTHFLYGYWNYKKEGLNGQWPGVMDDHVIRAHDVFYYDPNRKRSACVILYPTTIDYFVCDEVVNLLYDDKWTFFKDPAFDVLPVDKFGAVYFAEIREFIIDTFMIKPLSNDYWGDILERSVVMDHQKDGDEHDA